MCIRDSSGHGLLGAACVGMARHYGLPVEASGIGSDAHEPGIQAGFERALNGLLPTIAWPDILVGPGLLGGSMILCLEQLLVDCLLYTSPSPRDRTRSRMPSSA